MTSTHWPRRILPALPLLLLLTLHTVIAATPDKSVVTPTPAFPADDSAAEETAVVEEIYPNFSLPQNIFNEGKPFYVAKDPVTGKFDFNTKKTVGIQNEIVESSDVVDRKDQDVRSPNDINQIQPNFHDFLNLPVKYSSSKSVYPLISSSYSNLKYQGNNKHFVSNHKNYSVDAATPAATTSTASPNYYSNSNAGQRQKPNPQLTLDSSTRFYPSSATIRITTTTAPKPKPAITFRPRFTTSPGPSTTSAYSTITPSSTSTTTPEPPPSSTLRMVPKTTRFAFDKMTTRNKYMDIAATRKKFSPSPTTELPQQASKNVTFPTESDVKGSGFVKFEEEKEQQRYTTAAPLTTKTFRRPPLHYSPPLFQTSAKPSGFKPWKKEVAESIRLNKTAETADSKLKISEILDSLFQETNNNKRPNRTSERPITQQQLLNQQPAKAPEYDGKIQKQEIVKINPSFFEDSKPSAPPKTPFPTKSDLENMMSLLSNTEDVNQDQYVSFKVDQPNVNLVKYSSVPNMNNVVIAPNTDSASFVLGSQQSVGSGGTFMGSGDGFKKPQYQVGQVINEYPPNAPPEFLAATLNVQTNSGVTNFRFPNPNEIDGSEGGNDQIYTGSYNTKVVVPGNSVGSSQNKVVVFPPGEKMSIDLDLSSNLKTVGSSLTFGSDSGASYPSSNFAGSAVGSDVVVAPNEDSQGPYNGPPSFQQLPQNLRPPPFRRFNGQQHQTQQQPRPTQPQQLSPAFVYSEMKRRQPLGPQPQQPQQKPMLMGDPSLPNILPQFRPNAKIGSGHPSPGPYTPYRQPGYDKRPLTRTDMSNARPPPPSFTVRRTPLPTRLISRINKGSSSMAPSRAPYQNENVEPNRRFYNKMSPNPMHDRMYMQARPAQAPIHIADQPQGGGFVDDYTDGGSSSYSGPVPPAESKSDKFSLAYEEHEYGMSPPQRPQATGERVATFNTDTPKLEPVVTLQMLQFQKGLIKKPPASFNSFSSAPASGPQYDPIRPQASSLQATAESKNPVYVVYPVKKSGMQMDLITPPDSNDAIVIGQRGNQQPTPPVVKTPPIGAGSSPYENTPFSVITHAYQEPILKDKAERKKPNSFPYHLEKPEKPDGEYVPQPNHNEQYHDTYEQQKNHHDTFQDELNQIYDNDSPKMKDKGTPVVISSTLKRVSDSTPIAIAYTPTEPNYASNRQDFYNPYLRESADRFSMPNYGQAVISEIRDDVPDLTMVQDENIDLGQPPRGATLEQNFQAPFYASVSVSNNDMVTNPYEGWSVVTTPSSKTNDMYSNKNSISRSDVHVAAAAKPAVAEPLKTTANENSTKSFDKSNFQPEFLSGFQPIYPQTVEPRNGAPHSQTEAEEQTPKITTKPAETQAPTQPKTDKTKKAASATTTLATKPAKGAPTAAAATMTTTTTAPVVTTTTRKPAAKVVAVETKEDTKKKESNLSFDSLEAFFDELTRDYVDEESTTSRTE